VIQWRAGTVVSLGRSWAGAQELSVTLERPLTDGSGDGAATAAPGEDTVRALAYPAVVGAPRVGDRVLLNVTALAKGLGTGGYALVVAVPDRLPDDPPPGPGHLVKARYTPGQVMVLGVDEQDSPHHGALEDADSIGGMPVVVADLHSALPAVVAGILAEAPGASVASIMTDGGALPAWFSRTTAALTSAGSIAGTVTVGQSFGGDVEAVTVHTGLLGARIALGADVAVVAQGPGNLGTGTRWGFSGVAAGEAINAVGTLGGRPVAALRMSGTDARRRHLGLSHHSVTALGRVALAPADVAVPRGVTWPGEPADDLVAERLPDALAGRHRAVDVPVDDATLDVLAAFEKSVGIRMSTMGRSLGEDPVPFLAAFVAGRHAAGLIANR
jgi:hypothetical protein